MNNKNKGELGESLFMYLLLKENIPVSKPFGDNQKYDFIIDINNNLLKIQVKTGSFNKSSNKLTCNLTSNWFDSKNKKYEKHIYEKNDIDLFAFICIELSKIVLIPYNILYKRQVISINYNNKENSRQKANCWFYEDYNYKNVINKIKNNENIFVDNKKEKHSNINAYKKAINSESGFRGVHLNNNNGKKYKCYVNIKGNKKKYICSGDDAKELAIIHDRKAIELLGNNAITNKQLGLL